MAFSRTVMLERMMAKDGAFDGRFLVGVLTTRIYCLPSCPAKKPLPQNVRFFRLPEEAEAAGLRSCKRCRPDLFYRDQDPDRELVEELVRRLREDPAAFRNVEEMVERSGVGGSKLSELFRRHYHATPLDLLTRLRIEHARTALLAGKAAITDVAFAVGYETLSAFHSNFRRLNRMSPQAYRRLAGARDFTLDLPAWFQADRVLAYQGRDPESASEAVRGASVAFGTTLAGRPALVTIELGDRAARCRVDGPGPLGPSTAAAAHGQVLGFLGLALDPLPFERRMLRQPRLAHLIEGRRGLSIPQTRDPFDGLAWVIAGQQVSLPVALSMRRRLVRLAGQRVGGDLHAPPGPAEVARLEPADLAGAGFSRNKTEYLLGAARAITGGELAWSDLPRRPASEIGRRLGSIRGLGPWSVGYLMMRSFALADCVPAGDAGLARAATRFFALERRPSASEVEALLAPFAPYRSLASFHLWNRLEDEP